jgi:hypothetical protein
MADSLVTAMRPDGAAAGIKCNEALGFMLAEMHPLNGN